MVSAERLYELNTPLPKTTTLLTIAKHMNVPTKAYCIVLAPRLSRSTAHGFPCRFLDASACPPLASRSDSVIGTTWTAMSIILVVRMLGAQQVTARAAVLAVS